MPTLNWIGKEAVVKHHKEVPYRLLEPVPELSCGETASGNLIVQGDNLHALKALLPRYAGQVKCIYIDPPYNTGNEGWIYNDNVNSPEIRRWLGEVVGKEGETLDRHDRWLCMMYPRLVLLKQFLRENGAIFISIDDNEVATLRLLMDEIFGAKNFVASAIWNMMDSPKNSARHLSEDHEYVVLYAANKDKWRPNPLQRTEAMIARYKNPDNDPRGPWLLSDLAARNFYAQGRYAITTPAGNVIDGPPSGSYWRVNEEKFWELDRDNRIWWGKTSRNRPGIKRFLTDVKDGVVPRTLWPWQEVGSTRHSKQEISQILNLGASSDLFVTPKPTALIQRILQIATDKDSLVLDSFAGSGTTGHAVLKQNTEDSGNRRFILVEMDDGIARKLTAERVKRVVSGHTNAKGNSVDGLGGGFQFCRLSVAPLFDAEGQIRRDVAFAQLAEFVWFAETGTGFTGKANSPLLGEHEGRADLSALQRHPQGQVHHRWQRAHRSGVRSAATVCRPQGDLCGGQPHGRACRARRRQLQANALRTRGVSVAENLRVIIIAGPNGAGKTTFAREFLPNEAGCPVFVNADLIAAGLAPFAPETAGLQAGRLMLQEMARHFAARQSFAFETTLAGRGYLRLIDQWQAAGYRVKLIFLQLDSPEEAIARVAQRVRQGGHDVPVAVIRRRFDSGRKNFEQLYALRVDAWALYDNAGAQPVLLDWSEKP